MIAILSLSYIPERTVGQYTLPILSKVQSYVNNLIGSYNSLVQFYESTKPNFLNIQANFTLYHNVGNTFRVIVMQSVKNNPNYVTLSFVPIGGNQPIFVMDYNETFDQVFSISVAGEHTILEQGLFKFNNTLVYIHLTWFILQSDITNDNGTTSTNDAQFIFNFDNSTISKSITTPPSNPISDLVQNSWFIIIFVIIGGIITIITGVHYMHKEMRLTDIKRIRDRLRPKNPQRKR